MKHFYLITIFVCAVAFGAKIIDNNLKIGDGNPATDKTIEMGSGLIKWEGTTNKIQFSNDAGGSFKNLGSGSGGAAGLNLLQDDNFDFESGDPPGSWTVSAGTFIAESGTPGFGAQSGSWDSDGTSQTLDSALKTIPEGLKNRSCNATAQIKWTGGVDGDLKMQVLDQAASVVAERNVGVTTDWEKQAIQFTCPSTGSLRVRFLSTVANPALILIDDVSLGQSDYLNISQTELWAHIFYPTQASCNWGRDGTSFTNFAVQAACVGPTLIAGTGTVDLTDDDLPSIKLDDLRPGVYQVEADFLSSHDSTAADVYRAMRLNDSFAAGPECGMELKGAAIGLSQVPVSCNFTFEISEAQAGSSRTIQVQGAENGTGSLRIYNSGDAGNLSFRVVRYPSKSAEAINLETSGFFIDANVGGGSNPELGSADQTTLVGIEGNTLSMQLTKGTAKIPCSGTNGSTGLTCAVGNESTGIVFNAPTAGRYKVCAAFTHKLDVKNGESAEVVFKLANTENASQSILIEGTETAGTGGSNTDTTTDIPRYPVRICDDFEFSSAGEKTVRLMFEQSMTGTLASNTVLMDRSASHGNRNVRFTVEKMDQQFPSPVFTDLNNSLNKKPEAIDSSSGGTKIVFAKNEAADCTGSPCTLTTKSIDVTDMTRAGAGNYTVNWPNGTFPVGHKPVCIANDTRGSSSFFCNSSGPTDTGVQIRCTNTATDLAVDSRPAVICIGLKP
jgi:hypothetical protein